MMRDRVMSHIGRALAAAATMAMLAALGSCTPAGQADVVARVDDQTITAADLMHEMRMRYGPSMLVEMIDQMLIHQEAAAAQLSVTDEEMELRWQRALAEAGSAGDLEAILEARDISPEEFRERLHTDLLLDRLVRDSLQIDEQEIADFYHEHQDDYRFGERVRGRMILVSGEENAETIADALEAGGDFEGLARALSIDPATKDDGGDMGWFERRDYAAEIVERAFAMEEGEVSEPFEAPDGWVILKVEGRAEPGVRPMEEVGEEVRGRIIRAKMPFARDEWIAQKRTEAAVRISDADLRDLTLKLLEFAPAPQPVTLMPMPMPMP